MDKFPDNIIRPFFRAGRAHWRDGFRDGFLGEFLPSHTSTQCFCGEHRADALDQHSLPSDVYIVYRAGSMGKVSMDVRVKQLANSTVGFLAEPGRLRVVTEEKLQRLSPSGAGLIFSKYTLNESNLEWIKGFRRNGNAIWVDIVDGFGSNGVDNLGDAYICSSLSELNYRQSNARPAFYLPHQVDRRWPGLSFNGRRFGVAYLGGKGGALHLDELGDVQAEFTESVLTDRKLRAAAHRVAAASHHLSIRTPFGDRVYKPAAKAFVAARFGAIFLGSFDDEESVLALGSDYPYLARGSSLAEVRSLIDYASATFLKEPWDRAVARMRDLRRSTCDFSVGLAFAKILGQIG